MKRPLLPVALLLIGGILGGEWACPPLSVLFAASFAAALAALAWERGRAWLLSLLIVLTGWTDACWHHAVLAPGDLRVAQGGAVSEAGLRGIIRAPPAQRVYELGGRELWHWSALMDVSEMSRGKTWEPVSGRVIATAAGALSTNFFEGQRVEVHGVLRPPRGPLAEGLFDARAYYARQGVYYQLQTGGANDWAAAPGATGTTPISERFRQWAMNTLALGLPAGDQPLQLTWTLLLDWKAPMTDAVEEPFMRAGTYHIFAVDGLRIGLLAGIGLGLLRVLRIPRALCGLALVPALWFYVGLTGWPASAIRAAIMASVLILGWACRRPGDMINSLCAAAFIILLWDPASFFKPAFSFPSLSSLCIALIVPRAKRVIHAWLFKGDPFLPDTLQSRLPAAARSSGGLWRGFVRAVGRGLAWVDSPGGLLFSPLHAGQRPSQLRGRAGDGAGAGQRDGKPAGGWVVAGPGRSVQQRHLGVDEVHHLVQRLGGALAGRQFQCRLSIAGRLCSLLRGALSGLQRMDFPLAAQMVGVRGLAGGRVRLRGAWGGRAPHRPPFPSALAGRARRVCRGAGARGKPAAGLRGTGGRGQESSNCCCARKGVNHLDVFCLGVGLRPHFGGAQVILTNFWPRQIFTGAAPDRSAAYHDLLDTLRQTGRWQTAQEGGADRAAGRVLHPAAAERLDAGR